ncbi:PQQ-binding-like beta-propeller repeat protein [Actinoplanes subtropicus]|uniref:outer membrane protein assembly factor BamB family protein n=1 Tax=Actinoplanes subtropicus TaxID=543632 RepID=UPI0004C2C4D7|nr:PQQ-binding-like beta-propeller repeat protein [Actinoplanes subtropicus]
MALIDLGDVAGAAAEPVAAPVDVPRLGRVALAMVAVGGLLAQAASAPPAPALVRPLWSAAYQPSDTMALDGRTVYLNRSGPAGPPTVTAYDLATGKARWSTPSGAEVTDYGVLPAGDVLLVPTGGGTTALDAATGERLWRSAGEAVPSVVRGDALVAGADQSGLTTELRLVGLRDGRERWRRAIAPAEQWITLAEGGLPTAIVAVTRTGDATVYGYADGAVRAHARIPWNGVYSAALFAADPYVVVVRTASAQSVGTVYRTSDLRPLWRTRELIGYVTGCGALICTADVRGVAGRDAATGREVWRRDDLNYVWNLGGDRLLLSAAANLASATTVLVDAATGRTIGRPVGGQQAFSAGVAGSLLLLRESRTPPGRTVVSRLDLATGRQTPLGTVERIADQDCRGTPGYLLCPRGDTLTVTAVS